MSALVDDTCRQVANTAANTAPECGEFTHCLCLVVVTRRIWPAQNSGAPDILHEAVLTADDDKQRSITNHFCVVRRLQLGHVKAVL